MEQTLRSSPLVRDAMVVGKDRPQPALLYIPRNESTTDIQPLLEEVKSSVPTYSKIVPELVKALPLDSEFIQTDKKISETREDDRVVPS